MKQKQKERFSTHWNSYPRTAAPMCCDNLGHTCLLNQHSRKLLQPQDFWTPHCPGHSSEQPEQSDLASPSTFLKPFGMQSKTHPPLSLFPLHSHHTLHPTPSPDLGVPHSFFTPSPVQMQSPLGCPPSFSLNKITLFFKWFVKRCLYSILF